MIAFITIVLLLFVLPDLYVSLVLLRGASWWVHGVLWMPLFVVAGVMVSMRFGAVSSVKLDVLTGLLLCLALPQVVFMAVSALGKGLSFLWHPALAVGNGIGIAVAAVLSASMLYGLLFGWRQLDVKHVDLSFDGLPESFEGYRIAQLSDLHVGSYGADASFLEKVVHRVHEEHPDLIVFTGDLINTSPDEIVPFEQTLSRLHAPDGVLSVLGNHDYCMYGGGRRREVAEEGTRQVIDAERRMGWEVLLNAHRLIRRGNDTVAVIGVENTGKPPFPEIGDLRGAMEGLSDSMFSVLLSHDPSHWRMEVVPATEIPLMLAGHTHAAQFKIGTWSPSHWLYPEWSGLYEQGSQRLFVSEGTGGTIRFRLGATPEIILFTLHRKK